MNECMVDRICILHRKVYKSGWTICEVEWGTGVGRGISFLLVVKYGELHAILASGQTAALESIQVSDKLDV